MDSPRRRTSVGSTSMTRAVPVEPLPPACSMIIDMGAHSYSSRSLPVLFFLSGGYLRPQAEPWTRAPLAGRASLHSSDAGPTAACVCAVCCAPVTGRHGKRRTEQSSHGSYYKIEHSCVGKAAALRLENRHQVLRSTLERVPQHTQSFRWH